MPPLHNGLGSEEDSLQSCYHLLPKAPLKSIESLDTTEVLRFRARFETEQPEDVARRFVISVVVSDQSVSIIELVQRNSGVVGGKFLERMRVKRTRLDGSTAPIDGCSPWLGLDDFYVGARVRMTGRTFILFEMDEYSAKYMEARPAKFARSDKLAVLQKVRNQRVKAALLARISALHKKQGQVDVEELTSLLQDLVPDFAQHEAFTIVRNYGDKATMKVDLEALPQLLGC